MRRILLPALAWLAAACGPAVAPSRGIAPPWESKGWVSVAGATIPRVELRDALEGLEDYTRPLREAKRSDDGQEVEWVTVSRVEFGHAELPVTGRDPSGLNPVPPGPHVRVAKQLGAVRFAALTRGPAGLVVVAFPAAYDRSTARPRPGVREVRLDRFLWLVRRLARRPAAHLRVLLDPKRYPSVVHAWIIATDERQRPLACAERSCVVMDVWFGGIRRGAEARTALALEPGAPLPSFARPSAPPPASQPASPPAPASGPASLPAATSPPHS